MGFSNGFAPNNRTNKKLSHKISKDKKPWSDVKMK